MVSFKLDPAKCHTITYGFEIEKAPAAEEKIYGKEPDQENPFDPSGRKNVAL